MTELMIPGSTQRRLDVGPLSFTAYEMGEGPLVLCLHGFPDTPRTWRKLLPALAGGGWRAVAVTARGYEASSQPTDGDYGVHALSRDVAGWMDALGAEAAHLVGHDWGASIAFAAAARYPGRVRSLTALAVPHPASLALAMTQDLGQLKRSWYIFLFQLAGLPELVVSANDYGFLEMLWRDWSPHWNIDPADLAALKQAFAKPGVLHAALAYYRAAFDPATPGRAEAQGLATAPISAPTLGLAGEGDGCISADVYAGAMPASLFAGGVRVQRIPHAGHFLHLEVPEAVNGAILDFLEPFKAG